MAVVTAGANVAFDMRYFELGDLVAGSRTYADYAEVEIRHGAGDYTNFYGDFSYNGSGQVVGGRLSQIYTSYNGVTDYSITGLNVNAGDFFDWAYDNDTDYGLSVMFGGADTFYGSNRGDWLESFGGDDFLYGYGGDDSLYGGSGNDRLDGGTGKDYMAGGSGNDVYIVENVGDRVYEASGQGFDIVYSSLSFSLDGSYIEDLTLTGSTAVTALGSSFANILTGNSADNFIDGLGGADYMEGGLGNDVYVVDNTGDRVIEAANQGFDLVKSSVSFTLGANVEDLTLTGSANINATGNALDNILTGNSGNNVLNGGAGKDYMVGGAGNDTYYVDNAGDGIVEAANGGNDTVHSTGSFKLGANLENLILDGTASINATGTAQANALYGNAGANVITGGGGADLLTGGAGADRFDYNAVSDSTRTAFDRITDLTNSDRIDLSTIDARTDVSGNNAFALVNAFSGVSGQMTVKYDAGAGVTNLLMDINGDGVADMRIVLDGDHHTYTNFVF